MSRVPLISRAKEPASPAGPVDLARTNPLVPVAPMRGSTFVVKLRDPRTRSWGNEIEVVAASAPHAAEKVALGERLLEGPGERSNLRARVWKTPHGSAPDLAFYSAVADPSLALPL